MKPPLSDTHADTETVLISLLKDVSISKRFLQVCSLSQTTINLSKRAIARANPNLDKNKINLLFVEYHYGKNLAESVKKYIEKTGYDKF